MWTANSQFYDEVFRTVIIDAIQQERPTFRQAHSGDDYMEFGRRFQDVEEIWQAVCMILEGSLEGGDKQKQIPLVEKWLMENPTEMKKVIWQALKMAAETDYHYLHEKKYYEEPVPEVEKEDV